MTLGVVKVGLVQTAVAEEKAENVASIVSHMEHAAERGAQIICLPELFATRYFCQTANAKNFEAAEEISGPTALTIADAARRLGVTVLASIFERRAAGIYHNTALVIGPGGERLGLYRKMHIPDDPHFGEKYYFTPGDTGFVAVTTPHATLGPLVCWDQWYPEAARLTALRGAEILMYPTAIGWLESEKAEFGAAQLAAWQTMQKSHAIANGVFVIAVNRVGFESVNGSLAEPARPSYPPPSRPSRPPAAHAALQSPAASPLSGAGAPPSPASSNGKPADPGIEFWGHSFVVDPSGVVLAEAGTEEEVLVVELDLDQIERQRRDWPFLRDRRIDAYGALDRRFIDQ